MRTISPQLEAHFASGLQTLATCWKLTREDAVEMGFTDHDAALTIDSLQYDSIAGFTPTTVESKSNMSVDNLDLEGQTFSTKITEEELLAGLYDYAEIEIFVVNYEDLSQGKMVVKRGRLGEVTLNSQMFQAEVRGLTQHLSQTIGEVFSPSCRAILGDSRCKVALAGFTIIPPPLSRPKILTHLGFKRRKRWNSSLRHYFSRSSALQPVSPIYFIIIFL